MNRNKLLNVLVLVITFIIACLITCTFLLKSNKGKEVISTVEEYEESMEDVDYAETETENEILTEAVDEVVSDNTTSDTDTADISIQFNKDENGPGDEFYSSEAWLEYYESDYYIDNSINWRKLDDIFKGDVSNAQYIVDINYSESEGICTIFVINAEDMNDTIAEFR